MGINLKRRERERYFYAKMGFFYRFGNNDHLVGFYVSHGVKFGKEKLNWKHFEITNWIEFNKCNSSLGSVFWTTTQAYIYVTTPIQNIHKWNGKFSPFESIQFPFESILILHIRTRALCVYNLQQCAIYDARSTMPQFKLCCDCSSKFQSHCIRHRKSLLMGKERTNYI